MLAGGRKAPECRNIGGKEPGFGGIQAMGTSRDVD
jgi:hypothetical protein